MGIMKKSVKGYMVACINKGVRKWFVAPGEEWVTSFQYGCMFNDKKDAEEVIKTNENEQLSLKRLHPSWAIPKYEIHAAEWKILD